MSNVIRRSAVSGIAPASYRWDFDGACAPEDESTSFARRLNMTFSVGVFQWIPTKDGKGLKRGKVVKRITGSTSYPEHVYKEAVKEVQRREARSALLTLSLPYAGNSAC
jgi:hypothetical protein